MGSIAVALKKGRTTKLGLRDVSIAMKTFYLATKGRS